MPVSGIDQTSLAWIKPEIDACLGRAAEGLERYAENDFRGDDANAALAELHEVRGVLRVLELYGAAMVTEEMELLLGGVIAGQVTQVEDALTSLLRAALQLPDYLERLQAGNRDVPIVLLPLLNDLRSCRGEKLLSESVLLIPASDPELPADLPFPSDRLTQVELERFLLEWRRDWQLSLLEWFRGVDPDGALGRLAELCDELLDAVSARPVRKLWWIASAVVEALREQLLETSISCKLLFGRLDREAKRLIDQGEHLYVQELPEDLIRSLLYYVAQAGVGGHRVSQVRTAFNLDTLLPSAEEIDSARGVMSGRNSQLLGSVAGALEEELLRVKDALDLFLRGSRADTGRLQSELPVLDRVADTLGILGLGVERDQVMRQRTALAAIVAGGDTVEDAALLDIASALLRVEQGLQDHQSGGHVQPAQEATPPEPGHLTSVERQRLIESALKEVAVNLQQSKDLFVVDQAWPAGQQYREAAAMLRDVAGALRLLEFDDACERTLALAGFLRTAAERPERPSSDQANAYADALSGLEYYLELVADHQGHDDLRLAFITDALQRLEHWPSKVSLHELFDGAIASPAPASPVAAPAAEAEGPADVEASDAQPAVVDESEFEEVVDLATEFDRQSGLVQALIAENGFGFGESSADAEIKDTFLDELTEEMGQLELQLPLWRQSLDDLERLRTIRRSFHTIKGSGRMVGAKLLGEFAWQIENLLNRVLNGHRPVSIGVVGVVEQAAAALPEFHAALCGDITPRRDVAGIMAAAQILADGHEFSPAVFEQHAVPGPEAPVAESDTGRFDPVLLEILRSEVAGHLGVIDTYLSDTRDQETVAVVPEHLLRAIHTLNGAFGAVEIDQVSAVTAPFEAYVRQLHGLRKAPDRDGHEAMGQASRWLGNALDHLDKGQEPTGSDALVERFERLLKNLPPAASENNWLIDSLSESDLDFDGDDSLSIVEPQSVQDASSTTIDDGDDFASRVVESDPVPAAFDDLTFDTLPAPDDAISTANVVTDSEQASDPVSAAFDDLTFDTLPVPDDATSTAITAIDSEQASDPVSAAFDDLTFDTLPVPDDATSTAGIAIDAEPGSVPVAGKPSSVEQGRNDAITDTIAATIDFALPPVAAADEVPASAVADGADTGEPAADDDSNVLDQLLASLPSTPPEDVDPDLAEFFLEEARELLDRCEQHLANRDHSGDDVLAQELARELHTLKGGARMAGYADAGELGHVMESLLETAAADNRRFDAGEIVLIGRCLDRLNLLIFPAADKPVIEPVVAFQNEVVTPPAAIEEPIAAPEPAPSSAPVPSEPVAVATPIDRPAAPRAFGPLPVQDHDHAPESAVGEVVRVRADQLDALVNLAGEVGIIRTRLEQQIGAFRFNLEELEQTVLRLREQMRKLEIEAETQILSREVRVQDRKDELFDPLEMDRFSQLQQLSRALAESMSDLQSIQGLLEEHTRLAESLLLQQSRAGAELQEGLMRARMVPFESVLPRLRRLVRQEGEALGKRVQLIIDGGQGELDRGVLERMAAPFEHMLRNALVHGLEMPDERLQAGKSEEGEIRLRVARQATEVIIEVIDNGRGIDPERVRRIAIQRGLLAAESDLSDRDLFGFIMEPGFTTADQLTQYAGRGVGLDVVASEIKQLGGTLSIDSTRGKGTTFSIRLPYTLAVSQAVLVRVGQHTFAVPMAGVQGIVRLAHGNYVERMSEAQPKIDYAGEDYDLFELDNMLNLPAVPLDGSSQIPLLMIRAGDLRAALRVDTLLGGREIVVKPVGPQLARIPGVFGATILGDGAVVVILDIAVLLRRAAARRERGEASATASAVPVGRLRPLVLVVDDSITMRKVSSRVLEREGYEVHSAKDGLDALEQMNERIPDLILLDLEMPRMDGYEFAGYVREDLRFKQIPIIVITSRVGEKHRARAFELGVDRYLGKPYQESEMVDSVAELLAERSGKTGQ